MKFIKTIFLSLLALILIAVMGVFIFFQTFDTDQYLPQITDKLALIVGRPVSVGHVGLGLSWRGISLDAGPITVPDDSNFTSEPFIQVDRVRITPDIRALVLQRKLYIQEIIIQSPQIHIIRSEEGNFNIQKLGRGDIVSSVMASTVKPRPGGAALPSAPHNDNKKHVGFLAANIKSIIIQDAAISFIDQSESMPLDIWLTDINARLDNFSLTKPFRFSFGSCLYSHDPNVHGSVLLSLGPTRRSLGISNLSLLVDLSHLDLDRLEEISFQLKDDPVLKDITGVIQLNLAHLGTSASGDLETNGGIIITNITIKNFNIIKTFLSPVLGALGSLNDLINRLGGDDTTIEKADAQFSLHDKTVVIDDSSIHTNILEVTAKGSVDQGLNTDMQTMLYINPDVTATLVNQFDGLKILCDNSNRIAISASLQGVIPHLKYKPNKDFRKKAKKFWMSEGGNILGALFGGR